MPDDRTAGPGSRGSSGSPRARRRRSIDTHGGISVSDVLAQHTGIRPNFEATGGPAAPSSHEREPEPEDPHPSLPPVARRQAPPPPPRVKPGPPVQRRTPAPPAQPPAGRPPARPVPPSPAPRPPVVEPELRRAPEQPFDGRRGSESMLPPDVRRAPGEPRHAEPTPMPPEARRAPEAPPVRAPKPPMPPENRRAPELPMPPEARRPPEVPKPPRANGLSRRPPITPEDRLTMTDEMEPIDDSTKVRRKIDHTLARFSAAHDQLEAEEAQRKQRLERFTARPAQLFEQTRTAFQRAIKSEAAEPTRSVASPDEPAPQTRLQEKKERKTRRSVLSWRIAAAVLAALVFLGTGAAWGTKTWFNSKFTEIAALDENSSDIQDAPAQTGDENFLIAGSDTRAGSTAEENVGSADDVEGARSDTVMLAHIPADRQRAVVISFPRDLEISRPDCNRFDSGTNDYSDEVVPGATKVKLNTAYAVGGPRCLTKWVQQLTGMRINHFVGIDFSGFKDMVDAVGGVTVHVDSPIKDTVLGMVVSQTGDVTISGDQALSFVRARHVIGDVTSDYGRIKRQQEFIGSLMTKVMSHGVLTNPGQLSGFVTAFAKATFGDNIGVDQMLTLAQSMKGLDASKVNFMTVPTTGESNSRGNEVLLDSKAKAIFQALIDNTALPGTTPESTSTAAGSRSSAPSSTSKSEQ